MRPCISSLSLDDVLARRRILLQRVSEAHASVLTLRILFAAISTSRRVAREVVQVGFLAFLAGCADVPRIPAAPMESIGSQYAIAVVPARDVPESNFSSHPYREDLAKGAAAGAGAGAVGAAVMMGALAIAAPPFGLALGLAMAPVLVGGGALGGLVVSAAYGPGWAGSTDVAEQQRTTLIQALNSVVSGVPLPDLTADVVVRNIAAFTPVRAEVVPGPVSQSDRPDYQALRYRGFGGALEIRYTGAGFTGVKEDGLSLFLTAEAHLIDTGTGKPTWFRGLVYESPNYSASRWLREDAALMRTTLERAYAVVAERIVDILVLSTEPSATNEPSYLACGVALLEPGPALEPVPKYDPRSMVNTQIPAMARAASLTPVLAWAALPDSQSVFAKNPWTAAKDLRYDLRIWKAVDDVPEDIAYERLGLTNTQHQIAVALEPASTYFWSVRMRGTVDGRRRATPWSFAVNPQFVSPRALSGARFYPMAGGEELRRAPCYGPWNACGCLDFIPAPNFYRFRTP